MTIGERIKKIREEKGISQTELADIANTTKQNIYKYENNIITNIPSDKIENIAKYLKVSPAYLMGWITDSTQLQLSSDTLSNHEKHLIQAYRSKPKIVQEMVDKMLDIK